jgi:hypothetical protein
VASERSVKNGPLDPALKLVLDNIMEVLNVPIVNLTGRGLLMEEPVSERSELTGSYPWSERDALLYNRLRGL